MPLYTAPAKGQSKGLSTHQEVTRQWIRGNPCMASRVDYCNAVYVMSPQTITNRLQRVMNAAARVVSYTGEYDCTLKTKITRRAPLAESPRHDWIQAWCDGVPVSAVCMTGRLDSSLITLSQPLMLLLAVFVGIGQTDGRTEEPMDSFNAASQGGPHNTTQLVQCTIVVGLLHPK